jgi:hypothetical protein
MKYMMFFLGMIITGGASAQSKDEIAVAKAVEELRIAMVDADQQKLQSLTSEKLSYGHSGGAIDNKTVFVQKLTSGASDFQTLEFSAQTISVNGNVAIVRHELNGKTNDGGKPGEVHLKVLLVWQKEKSKWILIARQAVKLQ